MSTADVGIRIVLEDSTGAGFNALYGNLNGIGGLLGGLAHSWSSLSTGMQIAGITAAGSGVLFAGFVSAIRFAVSASEDLEFSTQRVVIAMDGAGAHVDDLTNFIMQMANTSQYTSSQIADGFVSLGQHAITYSDIIHTDVAQSMVDLAEATQTGPVPAAQLLTSVMQSFNLKASDSRQIVNMLAYSFDHGVNSLAQMQQGYNQFAPVAASMGVSLEDATAVLDVLNQKMNSGQQSGTALRYILQSFSAPTVSAAQEFAALGIIVMNKTSPALLDLEARLRAAGTAGAAAANAFDNSGGTVYAFQNLFKEAQKLGLVPVDGNFFQWGLSAKALSDSLYNANGQFIGLQAALQLLHDRMTSGKMSTEQMTNALETLFSKNGAKGALELLQTWDQTANKLKVVNEGLAQTNTAQQKAEQITATFKVKVQELQTSFTDLMAKIGTPIRQVLTELVTQLNAIIGAAQRLPAPVLAGVAGFLIIGAAVTGLTFILSSAIFLFGLLGTILWPVLAVIAGLVLIIAGVTAGIALMRSHWQQMMTTLGPILFVLRYLGTFLSTVLSKVFASMGNDVRGLSVLLGQGLGPILPRLQSTWANLVQAVQAAAPIWKLLLSILVGAAAVLGGVLIGAIHGLALGLTTLLAGLMLILTGAIRVFSGIIQVALGFVTFVAGLFQTFYQLITGQNLTGLNHIRDGWNAMSKGVVDIAKGLWNIVGGLFVAAFGSIIAFGAGFVMGLIHWFQHLFDTLVGHSIVTDLVHIIVSLFQWLLGVGPAIIAALVSSVIGRFESLFSSVTSNASGFVDRVRGVFSQVGGMVQSVVGAFQSMSGGISGAISTALGWINNLTGAISGAISAASNAGHSIGSALHIPGFAGGGIVSSPTFAMVGEGGEPEVILPVSKMIQAAQMAASGNQGGGGTLSINLNVDGQTMSQVVIDRVSGRLLMNGAGRTMN